MFVVLLSDPLSALTSGHTGRFCIEVPKRFVKTGIWEQEWESGTNLKRRFSIQGQVAFQNVTLRTCSSLALQEAGK